jgi:hypothetical protein
MYNYPFLVIHFCIMLNQVKSFQGAIAITGIGGAQWAFAGIIFGDCRAMSIERLFNTGARNDAFAFLDKERLTARVQDGSCCTLFSRL